ncbi:biotin/lipoyl-binding protein [bacterium]|nr:biotin/lipoyl-binding protein [bacterium]
MKFFVDISDRRYEVEIPGSGDTEKLKVDGKSVDIDYRWLRDSRTASLIIDGTTYTADYMPSGDRCRIQVDGRNFEVEVSDERSDAIKRLSGAGQTGRESSQDVKAPMPGLVVKLNVQEGDVVTKGQGVIVVEAMKMENEIKTSTGGVVNKILVEPGKSVNKGDLLLVIEKET